MSAEPIARGATSTTSIPHELDARAISRHAHSRSAAVIPPGSGVPVPGRVGRVEHVDVHAQEHRAVADDRRARAPTTVADAELAHVVHEQARDARSRCQENSVSPGQ